MKFLKTSTGDPYTVFLYSTSFLKACHTDWAKVLTCYLLAKPWHAKTFHTYWAKACQLKHVMPTDLNSAKAFHTYRAKACHSNSKALYNFSRLHIKALRGISAQLEHATALTKPQPVLPLWRGCQVCTELKHAIPLTEAAHKQVSLLRL